MSRYAKRVQVLLTEEQYRSLAAIAAKEHKKIGVVVREAVEKTCRTHDHTARISQAATELLELARHADTEPPENYQEWEEEYSRLKWAGNSWSEEQGFLS